MQCPMCYNPMNFTKSKDLKKYPHIWECPFCFYRQEQWSN